MWREVNSCFPQLARLLGGRGKLRSRVLHASGQGLAAGATPPALTVPRTERRGKGPGWLSRIRSRSISIRDQTPAFSLGWTNAFGKGDLRSQLFSFATVYSPPLGRALTLFSRALGGFWRRGIFRQEPGQKAYVPTSEDGLPLSRS